MDEACKAINLKVIKRNDSDAQDILFSAKHVVVYKLNGSSGWVVFELTLRSSKTLKEHFSSTLAIHIHTMLLLLSTD